MPEKQPRSDEYYCQESPVGIEEAPLTATGRSWSIDHHEIEAVFISCPGIYAQIVGEFNIEILGLG